MARTVEINKRNDKIQKTGRAELPKEINVVSQRPEKETCPKIHEGKKAGGYIAKKSVFLPIQVRASSQTKGLERG